MIISIVIIFVMLCFCSAAAKDDEKCQKREHVSTFFTTFNTSSDNREYNIKLATSAFSWLKVLPRQKLSFNEIVGKRSSERGYKNAIVISYGEYVEGVGGGVCQVSTTLYNAWIRAGLNVATVKNHTLAASYVELSQDATVSDTQDLVLENDTDKTVVINGYTQEDKVIFDIYATKKDYDIKIVSRIIKTIPPPLPKLEIVKSFEDYKVFYDGEKEYIVIKNERQGYISRAFMQYYKNGQYLYEKQIRQDYYCPSAGIIGVLEE